jgi:hypothetical protein
MGRLGQLEVLAAAVAVIATVGCGHLLGVDEYTTDPSARPACGPTEVLAGGRCTAVGVAHCGAGFEPDTAGGCKAQMSDAPCPGSVQWPGVDCAPITNCPDVRDAGTGGYYVKPGAPPGADGSRDHPYGSISLALDAIEAVAAPGPAPTVAQTTIQLWSGTYAGPALVVKRNVLIQGGCPDNTTIEADVTFTTAGANKAGLGSLAVKGTVFVQGAEGVTFGNVRLGGADAPALVVDDRTGLASVGINNSVIEGARGSGIVSNGGTVTMTQSTVRRTRPSVDGTDSCGLCLRASARVPHDDPIVGAFWDARASYRPGTSVSQSLIEDCAGVGVSVIGADATVTQTVVRSTRAPGAPDQAVGISVEERSFGNVPASLTLKESVVQGASLIGIRGRNARLDIADSVVRGIGGTPKDGALRCLGNGIRARWDRPTEGAGTPLTVATSLIEHTRETGILVEGGTARIEGTLVRDTAKDPCARDLGDGIGVYAYPFAPAAVALDRTRIDRSARAGVAAFRGATVTARSSAVTSATVDAATQGGTLEGALCGDATTWKPCTGAPMPLGPLEPAILGGEGCDASRTTVCTTVCYTNAAGGTQSEPLGGFLSWWPDHDEIAINITDPRGCLEVDGLPSGGDATGVLTKPVPRSPVPFTPTAYLDAWSPVLARYHYDDREPLRFLAAPAMNGYSTMTAFQNILVGHGDSPEFDLSRAPIVAAWACAAHPETAAPFVDVCRDPAGAAAGTAPSRQVAGVQFELDGAPLGPMYFSAGGVDWSATAATDQTPSGALALWFNVAPGEHVLRVRPKDATKKNLACDVRYGGAQIGGGPTPDGEPNAFRLLVVPGYLIGLYAFCSLE